MSGIPAFEAYHGVSGSTHQWNFNRLVAKGYRIITLSVYGDSTNPLYAAVWVQRGGPAWTGIHGVTGDQYQAKFDQLSGAGYVPLILSATGTESNAVFAGTFELRKETGWLTRFDLTDGPDTDPDSFLGVNDWALNNNFILRGASIYGDSKTRLYAGIWEPNTQMKHWLVRPHETAGDYQTWVDAYAQLPFRPSFATLSRGLEYLALFTDDTIGPWVASHGLTGQAYEQELNLRSSQGFYPICVQGGGTTADPRYAVIFAMQDSPDPKVWTMTGQPVATLQAFDEAMQSFMEGHGVHAGQLAIMKNGVVKFARAYTYAEAGYQITQPSSLMRLASVSKAFTCAAIQKALDSKLVTPSTAVFPLLGIVTKALSSQTPSRHINHITVQHLIDHTGGWDETQSDFDAVFSMREISSALNLAGPPSKMDIARYMYGEALQFKPGSQSVYSNFGYVLLGLVIEKVSEQPFVTYLRNEVLIPMGINDVVVGGTLRSQKLHNEVSYDQSSVGLPSTNPKSSTLVPYAYGGEGYMCERMDSGGGLIATATDVVRLINKHAVWGTGGRAEGSARSGSMAGVSSLAESRSAGVDFAYIFNTRDFLPPTSNALKHLDRKLSSLLHTTPL